jgi:hypothetical protein
MQALRAISKAAKMWCDNFKYGIHVYGWCANMDVKISTTRPTKVHIRQLKHI